MADYDILSSWVPIYSTSLVTGTGKIRDHRAVAGIPAVAVPIFFHLYFIALLITGIFNPQIIERTDMKAVYLMQVPVLLSLGVLCMVATGFVCRVARMKIGK